MLTTTIALAEDHRNQLLDEARRHRLAQIAAGPRRPRPWRPCGDGGTEAGRRRLPVTVALVGVALIGLAATTLAPSLQAGEASQAPPSGGPAAASRLAEVATADLVYEPGHSSGWHVHPGVHSVVVVSGTLTVYDEACRRQDYGPGQSYLGGREPHLARNTGPEPVALVVTYVADPSAHSAGSPVGAPSGCGAA